MNEPAGLPRLVAHRGNAVEFPENTLPALESAVSLGVKYVEFDVQLTRDGTPVMLHDADLRRVGDRAVRVHDVDWEDLRHHAVSEPARFGARFESVRPASLAQVVEALAGWRDVTAFVEIKRASLRRFGLDAVLRAVQAELSPMLDRCVCISFDIQCVDAMRRANGMRIGWVIERYDESTRRQAESAAPDFLFGDVEGLAPDHESPLWPGAWQWATYEVRDVETARRCGRLGAAFVETMAVRELVQAYARERVSQ
jgi:glycerophosphoryl diester phosphodiesterase